MKSLLLSVYVIVSTIALSFTSDKKEGAPVYEKPLASVYVDSNGTVDIVEALNLTPVTVVKNTVDSTLTVKLLDAFGDVSNIVVGGYTQPVDSAMLQNLAQTALNIGIGLNHGNDLIKGVSNGVLGSIGGLLLGFLIHGIRNHRLRKQGRLLKKSKENCPFPEQ